MGYIDRAQVLTLLNDLVNDCADKDEFYNRVFDAVDAMPAADLAPKSEIEKLHTVIFKKEDLMQEIAKERNQYSDQVECLRDLNRRLEKAMGEKEEKIQELIKENNNIEVETASIVAREILALVWDAYQSTDYDAEFEEMLDKIEKKYTEDTE